MAIHPTAIVDPSARIADSAEIGPYCILGAEVEIGERTVLKAHVYVEGPTVIGADNTFYPYSSVGVASQDKKYKGERAWTRIGDRNSIREFVTIHRGTAGGGGVTSIGHRNLFMAYAHVAHDSIIGNDTIFGNGATLGGHVTVEDFATISAGSGVHQFCRVGRHAFIGGYSVVTKDALPFAKTVGNRPARIYGVNVIGLRRRGVTSDVLSKVQQAYRYLLQSKLNTSRALAAIEQDPDLACQEVRYLVEFIRSSKRGVVLRRPVRRVEEMVADE